MTKKIVYNRRSSILKADNYFRRDKLFIRNL